MLTGLREPRQEASTEWDAAKLSQEDKCGAI